MGSVINQFKKNQKVWQMGILRILESWKFSYFRKRNIGRMGNETFLIPCCFKILCLGRNPPMNIFDPYFFPFHLSLPKQYLIILVLKFQFFCYSAIFS
jgi:hypothetical protein